MPLKEFEKQFSKQIKAVKNAIKNKKIAHAYLLHSDDRQLSESFAKALAQALSCKSKADDGDACGRCEICLSIAGGSYPELFILMPTSKSRKIKVGEDENDQDSVRWFQSLFYYKAAFSSGKKIGIIIDADTMMPQGQNAFLKTLEEPPSDSYFIICTTNPSELLPTFRSRCQRLTLLRNSQNYSDDDTEELISVLDSLTDLSDSIENIEIAVMKLSAIFNSINERAESIVYERWKNEINDKNIENNLSKRIEERIEAAKSAEYILLREKKLSLIHTYFFQLYQLSEGIAPDSLPHPELLRFSQHKKSGQAGRQDLKKRYLRNFRNAEDFLNNMKFNVNESLAIRAFCYSFL